MAIETDRTTVKELLANEEAFATSLLAVVLDAYGVEAMGWDPETLWLQLHDDFGAMPVSVNRDKLQALILVITSDLPLVSVEAFNNVCNALSGSEADFSRWDPLSVDELLWGVYEIMLNIGLDRAEGEPPLEFSHEVRAYMGVVLAADGVLDPPDLLRLAEFDRTRDIEQFADDPDMFNAVSDLQKTERARLLGGLGERLLQLIQELDTLPTRERNAKQWGKFRQAIETSARRLVEEHSMALEART